MSTDATAEMRTVEVEDHLYERVEQRITGMDFDSVDEYVQFVLEEVVAVDAEEGSYEDVDDEDVQARLRSLGYLDA